MARPVRRILEVCRGYWPMVGGGEVLATRVAEGLARRGHRVRVLLVDRGLGTLSITAPPEGFGQPAGRHGVELVRPAGWERWEQRLALLRKRWMPLRGELRQWLRRRHRRALEQLLREEARGMDAVLMTHTDTPLVEAMSTLVSERVAPLLIATQSHLDDPNWPHALLRGFWPRAAALAVNTPHEAERLQALYGVDPAACRVTGCGADLPAAPASWPRAPEVLFLGRIGVEKRIDFLLQAMRRVWQRRPDARLVVAGARTATAPAVEAGIDALPAELRARVDCPRDLDEEAKAALLARARCLVLPSLHESFGIVLVEAWGQGTPVVALDTGVGRGVVRAGVTGLLAHPTEPDDLAAQLLALLDDPARAERLGAAGRAEALERHTWDRVAERYEEAVELACARFAGAPALSGAARG